MLYFMLLFYIALHESAPSIPLRDREPKVHIRLYAQAGIAAPGVIVTADISQAFVSIRQKKTEGIIFNPSTPFSLVIVGMLPRQFSQ